MTEISAPPSRPESLELADLPRIIGRVRRALKRRSGTEPFLPDSHIEIMRLLYRKPGLRVQDVAAALRLAPNTVSTLVQQMTRAGRIERRSDRDDRRAARLYLTAETRRWIHRRRDRRRAATDEAIAALPARDRAAVKAALPALERLADALEDSQ